MKRIIFAISCLISSPAFATQDCLIGSWTPDFQVMEQQFSAAAQAQRVSISGGMVMTIAADQSGTYLADDLIFAIENEGMPKTTVSVNGSGSFSAIADAGNFEFIMGDFTYAAVATVDLAGSPITIDIPFTEEMAPMGGQATGAYTCNATTLEFMINGESGQSRMVNLWYRQ